MIEITEIFLKDGTVIEAKDADIKEVQGDFFKVLKECEYCYLIPAINVNYIRTLVEREEAND